jgi:hypothetical protein
MTGESLAVDKYVADVMYYTTGCKRGKAYAIVTHSAKMSFVGRTASLVSGAKDQGHFKAIMNSIGTSLLVLVVGWILIAWIGGFYHHIGIATPEGNQTILLRYALILLIVGVPVGLPVVTTTTLAVGAAYLAKEKAIVQKLTAIESLAVSLLFLSISRIGRIAGSSQARSKFSPKPGRYSDVEFGRFCRHGMMCFKTSPFRTSLFQLFPIGNINLQVRS